MNSPHIVGARYATAVPAINVKEMTIAEPYAKSYSLLNVVSKEPSEKEWPGVVYD